MSIHRGFVTAAFFSVGILEMVQLIGGPIVATQVDKACRRTGYDHCDLYVFHSLFFWVQAVCVGIARLADVWYKTAESKLAKIVSEFAAVSTITGALILAPILHFVYLARIVRNARHIYRPTNGQLFFMELSGITLWIQLGLMALIIWLENPGSYTQPDTTSLVTTEPAQAPRAAVHATPLRPLSPESHLRGECPICYEMIGLHLLSPCGHPICRACFRRLQSRECPECRRHIDTLVTPFVTSGSFLSNQSNEKPTNT